MRFKVLVTLLLALSTLAGCLSADSARDGQNLDAQGAQDAGADANGRGAGANGSGSGATRAQLEWPALDAAKVRPGVQVVSPSGQCTSNFVFVDAQGGVYLGLAAHCVDEMKLGAPVKIDGSTATGVLAYSSWMTMKDVEEKDATTLDYNDFALIRVDDAYKGLVHPAMRHFGGPTGIASPSQAAAGSKVLTYGNSGVRQQVDAASWHEGYVVEQVNAWTTTVATATPGIPGDSGSGVLTGDGTALGILVTLTIAPLAGTNGVTSLEPALAYAREHAGVDVALATWELLEPGILPGA